MGLILLGVMDTFRYHEAHSVLLKICFAGLALTAAGTVVVYAEEVVSFLARWEGDEEDKQTRRWLRFWYVLAPKCPVYAYGRMYIEGACATYPTYLDLDKLTWKLHTSTLASAFLVILEFGLGITFIILSAQACWHVAGIFEWIMAFLGTGYMGLFAGFFVGYVMLLILPLLPEIPLADLVLVTISIQEETRKHRVRHLIPGRERRDHDGEDMDERERMPLLSEGRLEYNACSATQ
ncbi:hypothetical protein Plec18167_006911 [Paecilomyces lecythidis]|uniref:Uncharacterized protein n=1 Tax=Paecilomyces lecythidis TaxID=3004212 RepID=A0ABR3X744_9EURO